MNVMNKAEQDYWDAMPAETPGEPSPADCLAQTLLESRANILLQIKGRRNDGDYDDGFHAGLLDATEHALRLLLLTHLGTPLSPHKRYVVEHVLDNGIFREERIDTL